MTRHQLIDKGKIWVVNLPNNPSILFEGVKTKCVKYIKENYGMRYFKKGLIRLSKIIYEQSDL